MVVLTRNRSGKESTIPGRSEVNGFSELCLLQTNANRRKPRDQYSKFLPLQNLEYYYFEFVFREAIDRNFPLTTWLVTLFIRRSLSDPTLLVGAETWDCELMYTAHESPKLLKRLEDEDSSTKTYRYRSRRRTNLDDGQRNPLYPYQNWMNHLDWLRLTQGHLTLPQEFPWGV